MGKEKRNAFEPITLIDAPTLSASTDKLTVTTTLKGAAATEFQKMCTESGLNKSQLLLQMIYHSLGKTDELKDLYRRLAILAET